MKLKVGMKCINGRNEIGVICNNKHRDGQYPFVFRINRNNSYSITEDGKYYYNHKTSDIDDVRPLTKLDQILK
jgi:hypothetical protein